MNEYPQASTSITTNTPIIENKTTKASKGHANPWGIFVLGSTFLLMIVAAYLFFYLNSDFTAFHDERLNSSWGYPFLILATCLLAFKACFFIYTLIRYFRYKTIPSVSDGELPTLTVIVPAYNEGQQAWDSPQSLAASDYPAATLPLPATGDGSKDATSHWMEDAQRPL